MVVYSLGEWRRIKDAISRLYDSLERTKYTASEWNNSNELTGRVEALRNAIKTEDINRIWLLEVLDSAYNSQLEHITKKQVDGIIYMLRIHFEKNECLKEDVLKFDKQLYELGLDSIPSAKRGGLYEKLFSDTNMI